MDFKKKHLTKKISKYIIFFVIIIILFTEWYYFPRTYKGNITFETEDKEFLNIYFELSMQNSFLKPQEINGKIYVNGKEYLSIFPTKSFLAENKNQQLNPILNSSVDWYPIFFSHICSRDNLLNGLSSKFLNKKWIPYFIPKDQNDLENTIFILNLQKLFSKKALKACELSLFIWKNGKILEALNIVK